jgi:hypothetical protein
VILKDFQLLEMRGTEKKEKKKGVKLKYFYTWFSMHSQKIEG